ncbi:HlyD family efflux transporter periplasmic adaptor subunit [Vallitaleaceae bacterium 9-2]
MKNKLPILLIIIVGIGIYYFLTVLYRPEDNSLYYGEAIGNNYTIQATASGTLEELYIDEGDKVQARDLIAIINHDNLDQELIQADTAIASAMLTLEQVQAPAREENLSILEDSVDTYATNNAMVYQSVQAAKAAKTAAELALEQAQVTYDRLYEQYASVRQLYQEGVVAKTELQDVESEIEYAQLNIEKWEQNIQQSQAEINRLSQQYALNRIGEDSAKQNLSIAQNGGDQFAIDSARLALDKALQNKDALEIQLKDYAVHSYHFGQIESINYDVGEFVTIGAILATYYNPNELHMNLYVNEEDLSLISVGQLLPLTLTSTGATYTGQIQTIGHEAMYTPMNIVTEQDYQRLVFRVDVKILESESIRPGMLLSVGLEGDFID